MRLTDADAQAPSMSPEPSPDPSTGVVPDPVSRFPFHVADPDATLVRRPGGWLGLDGIEPDITDVPPARNWPRC